MTVTLITTKDCNADTNGRRTESTYLKVKTVSQLWDELAVGLPGLLPLQILGRGRNWKFVENGEVEVKLI